MRSHTGVGMLCPRTEDIRSGEHAGFIWCPARTATGNHPVGAVTLENGRSLVMTARSHPDIASGMGCVVIGELRNLKGKILL